MSTRCNITLHHGQTDTRPVILYHHDSGGPDFQMKKLRKFLAGTYKALQENKTPYWWDPDRVAAIMIKNSAGSYTEFGKPRVEFERWNRGIVPYYQPCGRIQGDINYLYRIVLDQHNDSKATIECYSVKRMCMDYEEIVKSKPVEVEHVNFND